VADPGLGDQIEAFLRNALDQKRLEDRLVREAIGALRQTLTGIERTLNTSGILSPGPGRDEQIKRLVTAVANSVQRTWGTPQLEVLQEVLSPFFAQQLEFARQMVELSGGTLTSPGAVAASQQLVNQAVNQAVIGGKTLADTLRVSVPLLVADRTERYIRLGMSDLGGEVVATYADAVVRTTSTNVEAIIRTGVHEVGSAAQMAIYELETDPEWLGPDGLAWTATLDSAVCPVCLAMDGTKLVIGQPSRFWDGRNKVSPHWQCRCYALPMKWRGEDMTSPSGKKVPVKRPTEGDKGDGSLNFKTEVVDWVRANPETTKQIFGRKIGEMLLGENGQKRIGLDRAVKLWQAPKAS
jgi:P2-related tail formation protein